MLLTATSSVLLAICFSISSGTTLIKTPDLPQYATDYPSLNWTALVTNIDTFGGCTWYINSSQIPTYRAGCMNQSNSYATFTCSLDSTSTKLTLTVNFKALHTNLAVELTCIGFTGGNLPLQYTIVQKCPSSLPYNVAVDATSFTFGSSGTYSCPSNSELFYSNGTLVTSSSAQTQCLADATWDQQENLECWNAPSVALLPSSIGGLEGVNIFLFCQTFGGYPSPYAFELVLPGMTMREISSNYSITLKREWNQQEIYCKAVTKYTSLNDKGKSSPKKMSVQYRPGYVSAIVLAQESSKIVNSSGDLYLNSVQSLPVRCSSDSNPPAVCEWLYCSSICINISSKCEDNILVGISGNLSCSAKNLVGSEFSANVSLRVVPSDRSLKIRDVNGATITNIAEKAGTVMTLHCSLDFDDALMAIYLWKIQNFNGSSNTDNRSIELNLTREDTGNYTCNTADSFMNYSETVTVDVFYKPVAVSQSELACEWSKNQQDARCEVPFYSNPSPVVTSLYKGEVDLTNSHYQVLSTSDKDQYVFSLLRRTVLEEDFGQYIVTVSNSMYIGTLKFSVVQSTSSQVNVGVIVGIVFGSLAAVALIAVSVYVVRRHQAKKTKERIPDSSPPPVVYNNVHVKEAEQSQDPSRDSQDVPNQQVEAMPYENVHHYEKVGPKQQDGDEDPYIDLNI